MVKLLRFIVLLLAGVQLSACNPQTEPDLLPASHPAVAIDCDLLTTCRVDDPAGALNIAFAEPPRALQPFTLLVSSENRSTIQSIGVKFSMRSMPMGLNHYALVRTPAGVWQAQVTLPICVSGRTDWRAEFTVTLLDRRLVFSMPFVLTK